MKKKLVLLGVSLLALGVLAGCNSGGGSGDGQEDGPLTIEFWHTFGQSLEAAVNEKAVKFAELVKKNEGVDLVIEAANKYNYNTAKTILTPVLTAGTNPTIAISYPDTVADLMGLEETQGQYVVDMESYLNNAEYGIGKDAYLGDRLPSTDIVKTYLDEGRAFNREGLFVLPLFKSTEVMLYNKDVVFEALDDYEPTQGMSTSQKEDFVSKMSWTDLMAIGKLLYDNKTEYGLTNLDYPIFYDSDSNMLITHLHQMGLNYSSLDENKNVILGLDKDADSANAALVRDMLDEYKLWHDQHILTTKKTENEYASNSFKTLKTIISIGSSGGAAYSFPEAGSFDVGFARVPYRGENSETPEYISQGPSVVFLRNKKLSDDMNQKKLYYAWKFYKYLVSPSVNLEIAVNKSGGYLPVRESSFSSESWLGYIKRDQNSSHSADVVVNKIQRHFFNSLVFKGSGTYRDSLATLMAKTMKGEDIDDALADLINEVKLNMKKDV